MSIIKQILHRKNTSGTYDEIYLKTSADNVVMSASDSTTVASKFNNADQVEMIDINLDASDITYDDTTVEAVLDSLNTNLNVKVSSFDASTGTLNLVSV